MMYLVQMRWDDGSVTVSLETAAQIINRISMRDCSDEEFKVFECSEYGKIEELKICGTWHDPARSLYIKVVRADGTVAFDGYGENH